MRTRTRNLDDETRTYETVTSYEETLQSNGEVTGGDSSSTVVTHPFVTGTQETTDVVTPDYKRRSAAGEVINNPYHTEIVSSQDGYCLSDPSWRERDYYDIHFRDFRQWNRLEPLSNHFDPTVVCPTAGSVDTDSLIDEAVTAVWAKVSDAPGELLVTVLEARKTYQGLISVLWDIFRVIRGARRRELKSARRAASRLRDARQIWLQARYNLRPLLHDARNLVDAWNAVGSKSRVRFGASSSDSNTVTGGSLTSQWGVTNYEHELVVVPSTFHEVRVRAGVLVETQTDEVGFGEAFGLSNFYSALWELTPYSFVWDWFFNTAQFVASWSPLVAVKPLTSWAVVEETTTQTLEVSSLTYRWLGANGNGWWWLGNPGTTMSNLRSFPSEHRVFRRERIPRPDKPVFPSLNVRLDGTKLIDLLALATQVLDRRGS